MDTRIYVMAHKKYEEIKDDTYISLHVGKKGKQELGFAGDDTGDSISEKNASFCELTGIYWIWKNISCDIIGINHYRRFFETDHQLLTKPVIEKILEEYDCILPRSAQLLEEKSLKEHYLDYHYEKDYDTLRMVLQEKYPEYVRAFDFCMEKGLFSVGNMIITRKEIFDDYCSWLFDILFEVEKRTDISKYDSYQKRIYGFMAERLLRIWLIRHSYRIKEVSVYMPQ